jgi:hypothetical protein
LITLIWFQIHTHTLYQSPEWRSPFSEVEFFEPLSWQNGV